MKEVIYFTASWCEPCKDLLIKLMKWIASARRVNFVVIDVIEDVKTAEKYGVKAVPSFVKLENEEIVMRYQGIPKDQILDELFA